MCFCDVKSHRHIFLIRLTVEACMNRILKTMSESRGPLCHDPLPDTINRT